ncbi:MAG: chorismate--pyruvate lyase family protein [Methylophilaceae bacterium]
MLSHAYQPWLIDNGSLTALLQQRYVNFSVRPVTLEYAKPLLDEAVLLKHSCAQRARIREVLLMGNQQPVVFAHSVLPSRSLRGEWHRLGKLGNKPLGATLFANPKVKRTPLAFKKLSRHHPLYRRAIVHVAQPTAFLWARRSVFNLNCANILVTEVFLPPIL